MFNNKRKKEQEKQELINQLQKAAMTLNQFFVERYMTLSIFATSNAADDEKLLRAIMLLDLELVSETFENNVNYYAVKARD